MMPFKLKVLHKGLILVGVPLMLELALIGSLSFLLYQSDQEKQKEVKYRQGAQVIARLFALNVETPLMLAASMEYKSDRLFKNYERNRVMIDRYTREAKAIRKRCPEVKVGYMTELLQSQAKMLEICDRYEGIMKKKNTGAIAYGLFGLSKDLNRLIMSSSEKLYEMEKQGDEQTSLSRKRQEAIRKRQGQILFAGIIGNILAGIALALYYRRDITNRIHAIMRNTMALANGEPMQERLSGSDEISLVDWSFHSMQEQLKAASERERDLFNNASDVICVLNQNNEFCKINPICEQCWGYIPDELIGTSVSKIGADSFSAIIVEKIAQARSTQEPLSFESTILKKSGQEREMLWSVYWSAAEQSLFCIVHDLTEQKEAEREKAHFLDLISSNLRKPLYSISSNLNDLTANKNHSLSEISLSKLQQSRANVGRLLELVDELLQMNELKSGKFQVKIEKCHVAEILKSAISSVDSLAEKKNIKIDPHSLDTICPCDGKKLVQVLVNLLSNAIKFSREGSSIIVSTVLTDKNMVRFEVVDRGRGIPDSLRQEVFSKFGQAQIADGKRRSGTGLGLPICKQIVEAHGGEIGVESQEGEGSTFWFTVPLIAAFPVLPESGRLNTALKSTDTLQMPKRAISKLSARTSKLNMGTKGLILVGLPVLCEIVIVASLLAVLKQTDREWASEWHERKVSNTANAVNISYINAFGRLSHDVNDLEIEALRKDVDFAGERKQHLYKLLGQQPRSLSYLRRAEPGFKFFDELFAKAEKSQQEGKAIFLTYPERHKSVPVMLTMFLNVQKIFDIAEIKESESPTKQKVWRQVQSAVLFLGFSANVALSLLLAVYFSKDINSRLMLLADNANRLANERPLNAPLCGSDELARLDEVFHNTAKALEDARKKERAVFDNSQDIVCVLSTDGKFLSINPACKNLWGYSKHYVLEKLQLAEITLDEDRAGTLKAISDLPGQDNRFVFDNRIVAADGSVVFMKWLCSRKQGEAVLYCVAHDISSRKELESLKHDFLAMVSHDLRSPLTAIYGTTQLTIAGSFGPISESDAAMLSKINANCRHLVELISDLLDLEKIDAGKMRLSMEEIEMADVLNKSIAASPNKQKIKLSYTPELDETVVKGDMDRLSQAVMNVINYAAIRSSNQVRVKLCNKAGWSEIQIYDSAPALAEMELKQLFSRRNAARDSAEQSSNIGSQLALELAGKIVESHGGQVGVHVESEGNVFKLRLPLDEVPEG